MATPQIGAETFEIMRGAVDVLGEAVQDITRPGVDGHGHRQMGQRAMPSVLRTMKAFTSAATAAGGLDAYKVIQGGDLVTVTYSDGQTVTNVEVLHVREIRPPQKVVTPVGVTSSKVWNLCCEWTVQQAQ